MSLKDCITAAQRQGLMTLDQALALKKRDAELARLALAPAEIRARIIAERDADAQEKLRVALLTQIKQSGLLRAIMSYKDARGRAAPHEALWMLMEHMGNMGSQMDLENKFRTILHRTQTEFDKVLYEFRKGYLTGDLRRRGPEVTARLENIVRELFGTDTGDLKAKQFAQAWTAIADRLLVRFNGAGGAIRKLKDWGLPQWHDAESLLSAGGHPAGSAAAKQYWITYITPLLNRERMLHPLTGIRMSDAELAESLSHVYDTIVSEGWSKREPSMRPQGQGALYKQHADHRFLHFKDAESWLQYQKTFGQSDIWAAMVAHMRAMVRDIAAMEVLGPNPEAMLNYLRQEVIKAMGHGDAVNKALNKQDKMWSHYRGSANIPVSDKAAKNVAAGRNLIAAASLGAAALSAITDHATDAVNRAFIGLPVLKTFTGWIQEMGPEAQAHAVRNGVIMSSAMDIGMEQARSWGATTSRTVSGFLADRVIAGSGLNAMTELRKRAFGLNFQAQAADLARFSWDEMPRQGYLAGAFRRTLERQGFDAASWDAIRVAPQEQPGKGDGFVGPAGPKGSGFLRAQEIEAHATLPPEAAMWSAQEKQEWRRALADRFHAAILREMKYSVVEPTLASRAAIVGTNQPGTFAGEMLRSAGQFKGWPIAFLMLHGERIFRELVGERPVVGAVYAGAMLITLTLFGAVALQLKEIANGRDPRRMDMTKYGAKFWGAALLQGGGLGIYGDFLFADVNRYGGSLAGTIAGPMVDRIDNIRRLTIGNVIQFAGDEKTSFGRELTNFVRGNMPGSSLWYAREAWNRVLMDQLQYLMDPDAHTSFRRQVQRRRTDYRQDFFWRPGESSPQRGPDFGAMFPPN